MTAFPVFLASSFAALPVESSGSKVKPFRPLELGNAFSTIVIHLCTEVEPQDPQLQRDGATEFSLDAGNGVLSAGCSKIMGVRQFTTRAGLQ